MTDPEKAVGKELTRGQEHLQAIGRGEFIGKRVFLPSLGTTILADDFAEHCHPQIVGMLDGLLEARDTADPTFNDMQALMASTFDAHFGGRIVEQ